MKECTKYSVYLLLFLLASCSSNTRYKDWEYVRLISEEPVSSNCIYKVQEVCHKPTSGTVQALHFEGCYNWHKKRATLFGSNTVFIQREQSGSEDGIASYYSCK